MTRQRLFGICVLFVFFLGGPLGAQAQEQNQDTEVGWEFQPHLGNILPNQIENVEEIVPQWGLRFSFPAEASKGLTYEFGVTAGQGEGIEWQNAHISVRIDQDIEQLLGIFYVGFDAHSYVGAGQSERKTFGGGHLGGGFMAEIRDRLWFRGDMKFNVNPGTSLYFGFGFVFRFPPGSDAGAGQE